MLKAYLPPFVVAALIAGGLTYYVKIFAQKWGLFDWPAPRKVHRQPTPRLGGLALVISFLIVTVGYLLASKRLTFGGAKFWFFDERLTGVFIGLAILTIVGIIDDVRGMAAWKKLIWQIMAAWAVVAFGITITYLRLPGGWHWELAHWVVPFSLAGWQFNFIVWGDLLTIFWIVLMINTLNFLDGLDGLAGGVALISALVISALSFFLGQYAGALLSLIFAGAVFGFLPWNFQPAKIFMGDSGSMFLGYMLGVLSVISGGKLATAFLVLGIPVLDVGWVALRRIFAGQSPFLSDKLHLHHRLLTFGLSQRQAVIFLYLVSAIFGILAVFAATTDKKFQLISYLIVFMIMLAAALIFWQWRRQRRGDV